MVMDRFDFSPLFRSSIGFDRLARMVDAATRVDNTALSYPPYNIEKTGDDAYRLTMAVAGFGRPQIAPTGDRKPAFWSRQGRKKGGRGPPPPHRHFPAPLRPG